MRIATYNGERSVAELARRLFQLDEFTGNRAKEAAKEAEAALRNANPQLQDIRRMTPGTVLLVPEVEGIRHAPSDNDNSPTQEVRDELFDQLRQTLSTARDTLEKSNELRAQEIRGTIEVSQDRELKEMSRRIPELQERLPQIAESAKADLKELEARRAMHKQGLAQLEQEFNEFKKRFS
ncbi:MAG TPA: hypothetical protein VF600_14180 [Abditibacteriaceae bacterium]|jgi:hypothetical protein